MLSTFSTLLADADIKAGAPSRIRLLVRDRPQEHATDSKASNPARHKQQAETNDPGPGCRWLGDLCQAELRNQCDQEED